MKFLVKNWQFIFLIIIVTVIQFLLLGAIFPRGFIADDWLELFNYTTFGGDVNLLDKLLISLRTTGLYHTYQDIYIGFLVSLFKGNYLAYQITDIFFKVLATISLYPLILVVFKRRLLAFLTTLLYSISYSSTGALEYVCTGGEYLAIFFMNIFLLSYYIYFLTKRNILLFIASILLFLSFMASLIRMFPLLGFVFFIEIFILIKSRKLFHFGTSLKRLFLLFIPFFIASHFFPGSTGGFLGSPSVVFDFIYHGNYHLLLSPFAGLGYTFLTNNYWSVFGQVTFDNFRNYLLFLLHGPLIIYSILAVLLGFLFTKKPLRFILGIILTNLLFEIVIYFIITNIRGLTGPDVKGFYPVTTTAVFFGFFIISVSVSSLLIWLRNRSLNNIFLWGVWLIKGDVLIFNGGVHRYMVVAAIGSSLFLSSLMVIIFDKIKFTYNRNLRFILIGLLFLLLVPIYLMSSKEIDAYYQYLLDTGSGAQDHEKMKNALLSYIRKPIDKNPALFYFETSPDQIFFPMYFLFGFEEDMHFQDWNLVDGCIGIINDKAKLKKSVTVKDGIKGFNASGLCVGKPIGVGRPEAFYRVENFHAFGLYDRNMIDIKDKVLKDLEL